MSHEDIGIATKSRVDNLEVIVESGTEAFREAMCADGDNSVKDSGIDVTRSKLVNKSRVVEKFGTKSTSHAGAARRVRGVLNLKKTVGDLLVGWVVSVNF